MTDSGTMAVTTPYRLADLHDLDIVAEARIETSSDHGGVISTTVRIVVDDGRLYVRSSGGRSAAWYREALANRKVEIVDAGRRLEAFAVEVSDPAIIDRVSDLMREKYADTTGLALMLTPDALGATMRLDARIANEIALESPANLDADVSMLGPAVKVAMLDEGPAIAEDVLLQPHHSA